MEFLRNGHGSHGISFADIRGNPVKMCSGRHIRDGHQIIRLHQSFYHYQYIPIKQGMKMTLKYIIMNNRSLEMVNT